MTDLVRVEAALLPREPAYRPIDRQGWYSRMIPLALGVGIGIGLLGAALSPFVTIVAVLAALAWAVRRRMRLAKMLRNNDDGIALFLAGDLDRAAATFDELCSGARGMPALHSIFVLNRGGVHLERGELDRAVGLLTATHDAGWIAPRGMLSTYYATLTGKLALAEALRGRVEAGLAWLRRARESTSPARAAALLLPEVALEARRGDLDRARRRIAQELPRAENLLTPRQVRAVRVLEAFSLRGSGDEYRAASSDPELRRALDACRDARVGELAWLGAQWHELREFLRQHGLASGDEAA